MIFISAGLGAASGILSTSWKTRKDLEAQYDIDLRKRRIEAYEKLWRTLQPLADYSPPAPLTYGRLHDLSVELRCWYFEDGGLFMSDRTRPPYFHLQQALTGLIGGPAPSDVVHPDTSRIVRGLGSRLRTASTQDVATRVQPRLGRRARLWFQPRISVSVDQRWNWHAAGRPCYFVLVENRSHNSFRVEKLELGGHEVEPKPALPRLLQGSEKLELAVTPNRDPGQPEHSMVASIFLEGGRRVSSEETGDVPIPAEVLALSPPEEPASAP